MSRERKEPGRKHRRKVALPARLPAQTAVRSVDIVELEEDKVCHVRAKSHARKVI